MINKGKFSSKGKGKGVYTWSKAKRKGFVWLKGWVNKNIPVYAFFMYNCENWSNIRVIVLSHFKGRWLTRMKGKGNFVRHQETLGILQKDKDKGAKRIEGENEGHKTC